MRKDFFKKKLNDLLLEDSLLTLEQISRAEEIAMKERREFLDVLMQQQVISDEALAVCLSKSGDLPFLFLSQYAYDEEAVRSWDLEFCRKHHCIVFDLKEHELWVVSANPLKPEFVERLSAQTRRVNLFLGFYTEINRVLLTTWADRQNDVGSMQPKAA